MSAAEFTAAMPEPHVILGLRLLPLSLGRYRLLKRFESPFVAEEDQNHSAEKMFDELVFALIVCGLPCAEFKSLLQDGGLKKECKKFGKHIAKHIKRTAGFSVYESIGEFKMYLDDATKTPWHVLPKDGVQSESVSHWSHSIEVVLRSRIGWTAQEVDEEPISKALCDFFKFMESEDAIRLVKHEDFAELMKFGESNAEAIAEMFQRN